MGDDEFFGNNATSRNPLSLDELVSLSRQLLNVAFTLYWRDDQSHSEDGGIPGNPRYTWESVREKVTKCLLAIHAREYDHLFQYLLTFLTPAPVQGNRLYPQTGGS
jgi:ubiquitin-protein ligase E3 C